MSDTLLHLFVVSQTEITFFFLIKLYDSGVSSRWCMFILIRRTSRWVSQNLNNKNTQCIYLGYITIFWFHVKPDDGLISQNIYFEWFYCFNFVIFTFFFSMYFALLAHHQEYRGQQFVKSAFVISTYFTWCRHHHPYSSIIKAPSGDYRFLWHL